MGVDVGFVALILLTLGGGTALALLGSLTAQAWGRKPEAGQTNPWEGLAGAEEGEQDGQGQDAERVGRDWPVLCLSVLLWICLLLVIMGGIAAISVVNP